MTVKAKQKDKLNKNKQGSEGKNIAKGLLGSKDRLDSISGINGGIGDKRRNNDFANNVANCSLFFKKSIKLFSKLEIFHFKASTALKKSVQEFFRDFKDKIKKGVILLGNVLDYEDGIKKHVFYGKFFWIYMKSIETI